MEGLHENKGVLGMSGKLFVRKGDVCKGWRENMSGKLCVRQGDMFIRGGDNKLKTNWG